MRQTTLCAARIFISIIPSLLGMRVSCCCCPSASATPYMRLPQDRPDDEDVVRHRDQVHSLTVEQLRKETW